MYDHCENPVNSLAPAVRVALNDDLRGFGIHALTLRELHGHGFQHDPRAERRVATNEGHPHFVLSYHGLHDSLPLPDTSIVPHQGCSGDHSGNSTGDSQEVFI